MTLSLRRGDSPVSLSAFVRQSVIDDSVFARVVGSVRDGREDYVAKPKHRLESEWEDSSEWFFVALKHKPCSTGKQQRNT